MFNDYDKGTICLMTIIKVQARHILMIIIKSSKHALPVFKLIVNQANLYVNQTNQSCKCTLLSLSFKM